MHKTATLLALLILILPSLLVSPLCSATAMPKPSVPEFTLKVSINHVDHPAVFQIDPYSGENVTISPAYSDEWTSVVVTIKNQPFTPYTDSNGSQINLYYNIRSKGSFEEAWTERGNVNNGYVVQSDSGYTTREYPANYSLNARIDFQVEAKMGYIQESALYGLPDPYFNTFIGESSGWSDTQTITIGDTLTPSLPVFSDTLTPSLPVFSDSVLFGLDWVGIVIVVLLTSVVVLLIFVVFYLRRRSVGSAAA